MCSSDLGVGILSTVPGGGYAQYSGTSMATPHVAGAAALLASVNPALSPLDVKSILLGNVDALPGLTGKVVSGGRLNLDRSVRAAVASAVIPSVSGNVFEDLGNDGVRDATDPVVRGATVFADSNGNGSVDPGEAAVTSDAAGRWSLSGLPAGAATIGIVAPSGWNGAGSRTVTVTSGTTTGGVAEACAAAAAARAAACTACISCTARAARAKDRCVCAAAAAACWAEIGRAHV